MSDPLKVVKTIVPPAWMNGSGSKKIFDALGGESGESAVLFVGGCVRNALLGVEVEDVDLATLWTPEEVSEKLAKLGIKVIPTGIDHGTVTAISQGRAYEITTLRKDVETDGRHAVVAFSKDWRQDAERRDFTMNTLLADLEGNIFDPLGTGISDLEARRVVFVGEAAARIEEDHLRILRFFRFHALYGGDEPDKKALEFCKAAASKIKVLSKERITQEFFKILAVDNPVNILSIMQDNNILSAFIDFEPDLETLTHFTTFQKRYGLQAFSPRLFVFAGLALENIASMQKFLLFPKVFQKDVQAINQILKLPDLSSEHAVKVAVYKYGRAMSAQALIIELAIDRVMNGFAPEALKTIQNWEAPDLPISGNDMIKAGIKPGPDLGKKLTQLEERWISGGFKESAQSLLSSL